MSKFLVFMNRQNPQIVEFKDKEAFDATDEYYPNQDDGFMIAVGFVHFLTGEPLNDPRYVKWVNFYAEYETSLLKPIEAHVLHPCTDEDY